MNPPGIVQRDGVSGKGVELSLEAYNFILNLEKFLLRRCHTLIEDFSSFFCLFLVVKLRYNLTLDSA